MSRDPCRNCFYLYIYSLCVYIYTLSLCIHMYEYCGMNTENKKDVMCTMLSTAIYTLVTSSSFSMHFALWTYTNNCPLDLPPIYSYILISNTGQSYINQSVYITLCVYQYTDLHYLHCTNNCFLTTLITFYFKYSCNRNIQFKKTNNYSEIKC